MCSQINEILAVKHPSFKSFYSSILKRIISLNSVSSMASIEVFKSSQFSSKKEFVCFNAIFKSLEACFTSAFSVSVIP